MAKKTMKHSRRNRRRTLRKIPRRLKKRGGGVSSQALEIPANAHQTPANSDNLTGMHLDPKGV